MPFRCTVCNFLSRNDDNPACKTREKCRFQRVAVVHLVSPNGKYDTIGMTTAVTSVDPTGENETRSPLVPAKVHCPNYQSGSVATDMVDAVTCLDCLDSIKEPTPELDIPSPDPIPEPS